MGKSLDVVEQFFERAQHDGSLFLDPNFIDLFKPIADQQPLFAQWQRDTLERESVLSPDGRTKHLVWKLARDELLSPQDATNAATREKTVEYLEVQCVAALRKLHDPKLVALRDKLTSLDGEKCFANSSQAHEDTIGVHATNDALAESVFGTYDMILRRCPGISMEAASGVAQAVKSMMLSFGDNVTHRKKKCRSEEKAFVGWFHSLPEKEQEALVELARISVKEMRDIDRADHKALDEYHKARRKKNEEDELDALFTQYALARSFFERWCKRGVETAAEMTRALSGYGDRQQEKLDFLREQIEMRTVGLSWTDWKTPWSSSKDEDVGTVQQLSSHLKEVLVEEDSLRQRQLLPSKTVALESVDQLKAECPAPQLQRKTFKSLGTPTVQANSLCTDRTTLSPEQIATAAQQRRTELEAAGEIDWVCDRQAYATGQGPVPDKELVGKTLEVRWRYRHKETGKPVYIWCEGEVIQAADGEHGKRTARCKKVLPAGALRIKWPADVEFDEDESFVWSLLNPKNFNKDVHMGWRFAASELKAMEDAASKRRRRGNR